MFGLSLIATLALVPFAVQAQSVEIQAIEAHFAGAQIVPQYFKNFDPVATLTLDYAGTKLTPGQKVVKEVVNSAPVVTVEADGTNKLDGTYTLAMIDLDIIGANIAEGVNRHWLLNGVTVGANGVLANSTAQVVTRYWGPWPAAGSGPHRYVVALFEQPASFAAPAAYPAGDTLGVEPMDFQAYITEANLGPIVAANYINVEEGTATVELVSTAAIVTSTLRPAQTSASNSRSGSATGTGAPAASATSGAFKLIGSPVLALVAGLFVLSL